MTPLAQRSDTSDLAVTATYSCSHKWGSEGSIIGFSECGRDRPRFGWPAIRSTLLTDKIIEFKHYKIKLNNDLNN